MCLENWWEFFFLNLTNLQVKSYYDCLSNLFKSPENAHHRDYAKWKAAYIHNCLKNGEAPIPGPIEGSPEGPLGMRQDVSLKLVFSKNLPFMSHFSLGVRSLSSASSKLPNRGPWCVDWRGNEPKLESPTSACSKGGLCRS